jgi:hypothetical protein
MNPYIPAIVWLISAVVCLYIARARHVRPTLVWKLVVVILGPFAIPLIFLARSEV